MFIISQNHFKSGQITSKLYQSVAYTLMEKNEQRVEHVYVHSILRTLNKNISVPSPYMYSYSTLYHYHSY